jgi:hypothetical protein
LVIHYVDTILHPFPAEFCIAAVIFGSLRVVAQHLEGFVNLPKFGGVVCLARCLFVGVVEASESVVRPLDLSVCCRVGDTKGGVVVPGLRRLGLV